MAAFSEHIKNANWPMGIYLALVHTAALAGAFVYAPQAQTQTLLWAFLLWPISGLGITAGVHRLWAHRSYKAGLPARVLLMLQNSIANQGSIFHWSRDHRVHHKFSETDADPHNATRGFFFAHMGWLLVKKDRRVIEAGKKLSMDDLLADPVVKFQYMLDPWFALFMCFVFPALVAQRFWGEDFTTAFFVAGALRYVAVLHATWLVNSAAHFYGERPYDPSINPTENPLVSIAAIGEGWHNWHHAYPYDYSASEFGWSGCFNPSTFYIDALAVLGQVWGRKRATDAWARCKQLREETAREAAGAGAAKAKSS